MDPAVVMVQGGSKPQRPPGIPTQTFTNQVAYPPTPILAPRNSQNLFTVNVPDAGTIYYEDYWKGWGLESRPKKSRLPGTPLPMALSPQAVWVGGGTVTFFIQTFFIRNKVYT